MQLAVITRIRRALLTSALRARVRQCSSKPAESQPAGGVASEAAPSNRVSSVRSVNPGTMRVRRGTDPNAEEMEMDTTITRIMGSDWGDRSKQPVSYAMKLYWGIFILVLANGAFTYFAGKDESYLVDTVQKKVDEKLGRVETNEFVTMADSSKPVDPPATVESAETKPVETKPSPSVAVETATNNGSVPAAREPPSSMFASKVAPTTLPFFQSPAASQKPVTKADYQQQLDQLRQRQAHVRLERNDPSSFRSVDDIDQEIKRIDHQKAHIKQMMKKL